MMSPDSDLSIRSAAIQQYRKAVSKFYMFDTTGLFIEHWFRMPKNGLIPNKLDIHPREMLPLLPGVIMLERHGGHDDYRIRLMGTANAARWGFDATNASYLNFIASHNGETVRESLKLLHKFPCGVLLSGNELYTSGRTVRCETILFPVRTNEAGREILFGFIAAEENDSASEGDILAYCAITKSQYVNIGGGAPD